MVGVCSFERQRFNEGRKKMTRHAPGHQFQFGTAVSIFYVDHIVTAVLLNKKNY